MRMSSDVVFVGAIALIAFTDNAALTYQGSLLAALPPTLVAAVAFWFFR